MFPSFKEGDDLSFWKSKSAVKSDKSPVKTKRAWILPSALKPSTSVASLPATTSAGASGSQEGEPKKKRSIMDLIRRDEEEQQRRKKEKLDLEEEDVKEDVKEEDEMTQPLEVTPVNSMEMVVEETEVRVGETVVATAEVRKGKPRPPPKKSENEIAALKSDRVVSTESTPSPSRKKVVKVNLSTSAESMAQTPTKKRLSDGSIPGSSKKDKRLKRDNKGGDENVELVKETATMISKALPDTLKFNQLYQDEANQLIQALKDENLTTVLEGLSRLCDIIANNEVEFSKILRSQNLFVDLTASVMGLCSFATGPTTPSTTPPSKIVTKVKRSNTFDSADLSSSNNLLILFMESSLPLSSQESGSTSPYKSTKRSKSTLSPSLSTPQTEVSFKFKLQESERRGIELASCFIFFGFSRNPNNIEHFSRAVIEFIIARSKDIPENYVLEFFTTPSKLPKSPKSPKSPSRTKKMTPLEINIHNHFQTLVSDTSRFSVAPGSLCLATLANLSSKHINLTMKMRLCEYGIIDDMTQLLEKYILYLNPVLDIASISPKLVGNIEFVLKIFNESLIGDIKSIRERFINFKSLNLFITFIRYINIIISSNSDRLAGIDIKLIGTEAIISLLNILLNLTHENPVASEIIGKMDNPFRDNLDTSSCSARPEIEFKEYVEHLTNMSKSAPNTPGTPGKSPLTPRKIKFLDSIKIVQHFGFRTIVELLKLDVPEKFDVHQLAISLLVNLVECNPENREIFRSVTGAIDVILQLYLSRTSEKIITRTTSKTQEKVASSYLVILIGFLVKENPANRKQVLNTLPSHSFDDMVVLLQDFIQFQSNTMILTDGIYQLCTHLIQDIFFFDDQSYSQQTFSNYQSFKEDFEKAQLDQSIALQISSKQK